MSFRDFTHTHTFHPSTNIHESKKKKKERKVYFKEKVLTSHERLSGGGTAVEPMFGRKSIFIPEVEGGSIVEEEKPGRAATSCSELCFKYRQRCQI